MSEEYLLGKDGYYRIEKDISESMFLGYIYNFGHRSYLKFWKWNKDIGMYNSLGIQKKNVVLSPG